MKTQIKRADNNSVHGLGLGKLSKILWFHFNIYTMVEAMDFKFGTPRGKVGVALG